MPEPVWAQPSRCAAARDRNCGLRGWPNQGLLARFTFKKIFAAYALPCLVGPFFDQNKGSLLCHDRKWTIILLPHHCVVIWAKPLVMFNLFLYHYEEILPRFGLPEFPPCWCRRPRSASRFCLRQGRGHPRLRLLVQSSSVIDLFGKNHCHLCVHFKARALSLHLLIQLSYSDRGECGEVPLQLVMCLPNLASGRRSVSQLVLPSLEALIGGLANLISGDPSS